MARKVFLVVEIEISLRRMMGYDRSPFHSQDEFKRQFFQRIRDSDVSFVTEARSLGRLVVLDLVRFVDLHRDQFHSFSSENRDSM